MSVKVPPASDDVKPTISNSIVADIEAIFALSSMLEERFRYDLDTLRSESTASLRTLQDPQTPALSTGQNSVVDAFLTDDNGLPLLNGVQRYRSTQKSRPPTTGIRLTRIRSAPTPTDNKPTQRQSIITNINDPTVTLPLESLCDVIDRCSSLSQAQIITVEIHREWTSFGNLHRFLVMHLRRSKRSDVYLRMDRRSPAPSLIPKLLRSKNSVGPVDTVTLASAKSDLLNGQKAKAENRLVFTTSSSLRAFRFFVSTISEELRDYHVWPENSWQLCTLVQEYLAASGKSQFVFGSPLYFGLTHNIRTRVYNRIYHVPQGSTMAQLLQCTTLPNNSYWKETFLPKALGIGKRYDTLFHSHQNVAVPDAQIIDVCETLRVLSGHASDVAEGCLLASRASALYRQLALKNPERHRERFIAALNTHADRLLVCKRPEDACDVLRQVVQLYMQAYEASPRSSNTKLANSVRAYAKQVARAGPLTRDCNPLQDLLDTYQELYKRDPDKWYKELDETLSVCIEQILKAGRVRDALSSSSLILGLYRVRYEAEPTKNWLGFVAALQCYIERLFKTRRTTEAVDNAHELMRIYRTLWRSYSDIHRLSLAQSLESYSQRLFRVRRPAEACSALSEIVDMYRVQYAKSPEAHHMSLAESLFGYADGLVNAGRAPEACSATQEVVDAYRKLCRKNSATHHAHLAHALEGHANRLKIAGREVEAWARRVEIVDMYRDLDREEPGLYHREIAAALNSCADHLTKQGRANEACDAALEIVEYYRAVSGSSTERKAAGPAELSRALTLYANRLERAKNFNDACAAIWEIVELNRVLYTRHPDAHAWDMADTLDAYATRLAIAGRIDEACKISLEAVGMDRDHRTHRHNDTELRKRGCFERVFSCCQYLAHVSRYLEALDMAGDALEGLRSQRALYAVEEQLPPEREWLDEVETKLRKFVQDVLLTCSQKRVSIPSRSVFEPSTPFTSLRRSRRPSTAKRPRLNWEINRWKAQKAAEGRRWL